MNTPPEFAYFDLGAVLLSFSHEQMFRQLAEVFGVEPERVREAIAQTPLRESAMWAFEEGRLSEEDYFDHICSDLGRRPDRGLVDRAASEIFAPIEGTWRIVEELRASSVRLGVLSNTNPVHWRHVSDGRYPILTECFEHAVLSFEAKSMKPDPGIYAEAVRRAGAPAERVFFVDDRQDNVAGALAAGLDAVVFHSPEGLRHDLARRGLLAEPAG